MAVVQQDVSSYFRPSPAPSNVRVAIQMKSSVDFLDNIPNVLPELHFGAALQYTAAGLARSSRRNAEMIIQFAARSRDIINTINTSLADEEKPVLRESLDLVASITIEEIMLRLHPIIAQEAEYEGPTRSTCLSWKENHILIWNGLMELYQSPFALPGANTSWQPDLENAAIMDEHAWLRNLVDEILESSRQYSADIVNTVKNVYALSTAFSKSDWETRAVTIDAIMCVFDRPHPRQESDTTLYQVLSDVLALLRGESETLADPRALGARLRTLRPDLLLESTDDTVSIPGVVPPVPAEPATAENLSHLTDPSATSPTIERPLFRRQALDD